MNDKPETKIGYVSPLKRICMTIGELPSSYLETMSYYEMLVWFVEFLKNQVIPVVNNNSEATEELQHLFIELQSYVNNYFDNLDVQDEINNKLDEMAESGYLETIIGHYLNNTFLANFDDIFANTNNKFVMIGDSIGEGFGWWHGNINQKTTSNDGFPALIRADYGINFLNLSKSGSTIADIDGHLSLKSQVDNVPNDTTHLFILSGINDVTTMMNDNTNYVGYPKDKISANNYLNNDFTTTCNAFESCLRNLFAKNNNMKIYFVIEPTIDKPNYYIYDMCFAFLKFICNKYGVNVIDFRQMFRKYLSPYSGQYYNDKVHPNEAGYRYMYSYFKNHARFNINDNFTELPQVLIASDFNFSTAPTTACQTIIEEIAEVCPLWQQSFKTIVISSEDWGASAYRIAQIDYNFNYNYGRIEIKSQYISTLFERTYYYKTNKYDASATPEIKFTPHYLYYSKDVTNAMNITKLVQMNKPGIYDITNGRMAVIEGMHPDLKTDSHGYGYCEVLTNDETIIIQRWTVFFNRAYIYMAYITNANTENPTIVWRLIPTQANS